MSRARLLALALCLASPLATLGAQLLRGVVTDTAGRPLADAAVLLPEVQRRTQTDSLGRFALASPRAGRQTLRVLLIGYRMHESRVTLDASTALEVRVALAPTRQLLDTVRIIDVEGCAPHTVRGFECRRDGGKAWYRDAGEIRPLKPSTWADMLDGMPDLRRVPVMTSDGLEWRVGPPPGRCLMESYNGYDKMWDGHIRLVEEVELSTRDVVAIEYYDDFSKVPKVYERLAWPKGEPAPCALIVYWLRPGTRRNENVRRGTVITRDPHVPPTGSSLQRGAVRATTRY